MFALSSNYPFPRAASLVSLLLIGMATPLQADLPHRVTAWQATGPISWSEPVQPQLSDPVATQPESAAQGLIGADDYLTLPKSRSPISAIPPQSPTRWLDPLLRGGRLDAPSPTPLFNRPGVDFQDNPHGLAPPDTNGAVGLHHYVQVINVSFGVYDKQGRIVQKPTYIGELWRKRPGYCAFGAEYTGLRYQASRVVDPVVLYDQLADRWVISHASKSQAWCIAVSKTPDPTGPYYLYEYDLKEFPDYQKLAVWANGYYAASQTSRYVVTAFDRDNMLKGQRARMVSFARPDDKFRFPMPATVDGYTLPHVDNVPLGGWEDEYFYTFEPGASTTAPGKVSIYHFSVNFNRPADSTFDFKHPEVIEVAPFVDDVCGSMSTYCIEVPQPGNILDSMAYVPNVRFVFRSFFKPDGQGEAFLLGSFPVRASKAGHAGIRWFQLRQTKQEGPWQLHQEGTYAPNAYSRWIGSIAMDGSRDIALGYSAAGKALKPGLRYTTRQADDPPGTLRNEAVLFPGKGVQTGVRAQNRWGDYSSLVIDPVDDCTFWYTNEYYKTDGDAWSTRFGAFKLPTCVPATFSLGGQVLDAVQTPLAGVTVWLDSGRTAITDAEGAYRFEGLPPGRYQAWASLTGYRFGAPVALELPPPNSRLDFTAGR